MRQSGITTVFVIVCAAVLLGAYGIGLCIREVRFRRAAIESEAFTGPQTNAQTQQPTGEEKPKGQPAEMVQAMPEMRPMFGPEGEPGQRLGGPREGMAMFQMLPPEEAAELRERWPNMSEEERKEFTAQMSQRWENMSEQEKEQVRERRKADMRQRRERFDNMSEQEREEFRAQMRERAGGRRPQGDAEGARRRPGARQQENN